MRLIISDETLRDGEQQVGVNFSIREKFLIAKKLAEAGVNQIAIMPIVSKHEERLAKRLLKTDFSEKIYASTMLDKGFIDHSFNLGFRRIILFSPLSERLLKIKRLTKEENLKKSVSICKYANNKGMQIFFAGEDATRTNTDYIIRFIKGIEKFISGFILCDTVGILTPNKTKRIIKTIKENTKCDLGVHFHNDRGLANENTITAIKNGANIISTTIGGIGERAGNADLLKVLFELKKSRTALKDLNYSRLLLLKKLVYRMGGSKPAKPFSHRAFWHESGIHVNALLKDSLSYNSFPPEKFGKENKIFFGKFSGISNYRFLFGNKYNDKKLSKIRDKIKEISYKNKKSFSENEVLKIVLKYKP